MQDLVGDLLDVARIETGTLSVKPAPADLAEMVDGARRRFLGGGRQGQPPRRPHAGPAPGHGPRALDLVLLTFDAGRSAQKAKYLGGTLPRVSHRRCRWPFVPGVFPDRQGNRKPQGDHRHRPGRPLFPVAFWHDDWRDIWLAKSGYLEAVVTAGFDGVYLDWVEAYADERVHRLADEAGLDARAEMVSWVTAIADVARSLQPGFIVIAQNAAGLATDEDYLRAIDGIAQEQVWFDGGVDNDPRGDCPLPATDHDVEGDEYVQSLSDRCRRQHDEFPEGTLHVSSEAYLPALTAAQQRGELIFTVDYALDPVNVAWIHETARALGFVSFVGSRALNVYLEPFPY